MKKLFSSVFFKLLYSVLGIASLQSLSALFVQSNFYWLISLKKPIFSPPNYLFSPIWTILYILIAISFWKIWITKNHDKKSAYICFFIHLFFNFSWTFFFFFLKSPSLSFIDIIFINLTLGITLYYFWKISKIAALLLIPYWIWIVYATYINAGYWVLN